MEYINNIPLSILIFQFFLRFLVPFCFLLVFSYSFPWNRIDNRIHSRIHACIHSIHTADSILFTWLVPSINKYNLPEQNDQWMFAHKHVFSLYNFIWFPKSIFSLLFFSPYSIPFRSVLFTCTLPFPFHLPFSSSLSFHSPLLSHDFYSPVHHSFLPGQLYNKHRTIAVMDVIWFRFLLLLLLFSFEPRKTKRIIIEHE